MTKNTLADVMRFQVADGSFINDTGVKIAGADAYVIKAKNAVGSVDKPICPCR